MKNVVKKLFSLLLVGVVAISMFSFVAPTNVEATEAGSNGTLSIRNKGWYTAYFSADFQDDCGCLVAREFIGALEGLGFRKTRKLNIPENATYIAVNMEYADIDGNWKHADTYVFRVDEVAVNEKSQIELVANGTIWNAKCDIKINNGWFKDGIESADRGIVSFKNNFIFQTPDINFKITFYKDFSPQSEKLDEKIIEKCDPYGLPRKIKIPDYTVRIDVEIIQDGKLIDIATFKVCRNRVSSADVVTININMITMWTPNIDSSCSEGWLKVK